MESDDGCISIAFSEGKLRFPSGLELDGPSLEEKKKRKEKENLVLLQQVSNFLNLF
jgi:hypothetical protein